MINFRRSKRAFISFFAGLLWMFAIGVAHGIGFAVKYIIGKH